MSSGSVKPCGLGLAANSRLELPQPTVLEFREDGDGRPVLALTEAWEQFLPLENAHSSLLAALAEFERSRDPLVGHPLALVVPGLANPRAFRTGVHPVCLNLKTIASFHSPAATNDVRVPRRSGLTHSAVNFGTDCRLALRVSHPLNKDEKKEAAGKQTNRC